MKIFMSEKFTGLHTGTTLISLGLVAETGETFYAEFTDYDLKQANSDDWVKDNVLPNLTLTTLGMSGDLVDLRFYGTTLEVVVALQSWILNLKALHSYQANSLEIWGDCLPYAWVLFSELIDGNSGLQDTISYIPRDICTMFDLKGIDPDITRYDYVSEYFKHRSSLADETGTPLFKHNSLFDAMVIRWCYEKLLSEK